MSTHDNTTPSHQIQDEQAARAASPPTGDSPYIEYQYQGVPGLYVRVQQPDAEGRIRRLWLHRHGNRKVALGYIEAFDASEVSLSLAEAQQKIAEIVTR